MSIPNNDEQDVATVLNAFANGAWLGLKIAGMILSMILCILALLGLVNALLTWWGQYLNISNPPLTVELIAGYMCYPIAFLLGVPRNGDLLKVAQLIGTKIITVSLEFSALSSPRQRSWYTQNEFVAYTALQSDLQYADLSPRSRLIATFALCGFANISAVGIQISVLSQIAPSRAGDISRLAVSALLTGAISTFTSAALAGILINDQEAYFTPSMAS